MATDREKAIDLIQKLLMRTRDNGATESEAEAAAAEVQRLLTKFNLSIAEAERAADDLTEETLEVDARDRVTQVVCSVMTDFYFVRFFRRGKSMQVFGERHNVEVASYVFQFLHRTFSELCAAELGRHIDRGGVRCFGDIDAIMDPYCKGLALGLSFKLEVERDQFNNREKNALVVINRNLRDELFKRYPKLNETREKIDATNPATLRGMAHGERIEIREGIGGQAKGPERLAIAEGGRP